MQINNYQNYHETKQHTTAEFPYNTYPCSIPLDFTRVPLHWHDELELIVDKSIWPVPTYGDLMFEV